jgi:two-component system LytT family response regulator
VNDGTLSVLVVDDEALARERLRTLLASSPGVRLVGECATGDEAVRSIEAEEPDLVFLDVQMPESSGFDVIAEVGPERMPAVIFATAYDEFALKAFDANAVDYLLKPIGEERLAEALQRAQRRLQASSAPRFDAALLEVLERAGREPGYRDRFAVRTGDRFHVVRAADISWIEAADNYVRLHAAGKSHLLRTPLRDVEAMLDPRSFLRIHRSTIVNVDRVKSLVAWGLGEYVVELTDGTKLMSSRRYRSVVRQVFGV